MRKGRGVARKNNSTEDRHGELESPEGGGDQFAPEQGLLESCPLVTHGVIWLQFPIKFHF